MAASDALPAHCPFPGSSQVIGQRPSDDVRSSPGWGGSPQFPPSPSKRSAPSTPGGPLGLCFQALHPFRGLHPELRGSAPPISRLRPGRLTTRQDSLNAADRLVAPPDGAFDAGLRPDPFPGQAASLLPGLLAVTRTGLPPAGNDELMCWFGSHHASPPTHWAHQHIFCKKDLFPSEILITQSSLKLR
jgi:hypothetical protein